MRCDMRTDVFGVSANSKDPIQRAEIHNLIRKFTILCYVLQYPIIISTDSEAQSDLDLHCLHMPEDTFSQGPAYLSDLSGI